jgi:hypothetical protein
MKNIEERAEQIIEYVLDNTLYDYEASEKIIKLADEFAIGFAEWLAIHCYRTTDGDYWLTQNKGDFRKNSKELLEIYKKEQGL